MKAFRALLFGSLVYVGMFSAATTDLGCHLFQPAVQPAEQLAGCLVAAAASDFVDAISDPATLVTAVLGQCTADGVAVVSDLIAALQGAVTAPVSDASLSSDAAVSGQETVGGSDFDPVRVARLLKVRAAALSVQSKGLSR